MKPLTDNLFWEIVTEIGWPRRDIDAVKLMLMRTYPPETMEAMHITFCNKKAELARAAAVDFCCDSWDDTRAHIVGLGREEFQHNLDNPALILERESHGDYIESFAYCVPFPQDYELLTDSGYDSSLQRVQTFLSDLDNAELSQGWSITPSSWRGSRRTPIGVEHRAPAAGLAPGGTALAPGFRPPACGTRTARGLSRARPPHRWGCGAHRNAPPQ